MFKRIDTIFPLQATFEKTGKISILSSISASVACNKTVIKMDDLLLVSYDFITNSLIDFNRCVNFQSNAIMKSSFSILAILICILNSTDAQPIENNKIKRHGLFLEFYPLNSADSPGYVSINYEYIFFKKRMRSIRVGFYPDFNEEFIAFPITLSRITHPLKNHHFEYGLGVAPTLNKFNNKWWSEAPFIMFPLMYRYQKSKGIFLRGGFNMIIGYGGFLPHPLLTLGYKFL